MEFRTGSVALVLLLGCAAGMARAEIVLHEMPSEGDYAIAQAIEGALQAACGSKQVQCDASLLPDGRLLVEAPAAEQQQIAAVLKAIAARVPDATPVRTTLHYWAVSGEPGKPDSDPDGLILLWPVLAQIEALNGDLGFRIEDKVSLTVGPDGNASIGTRDMNAGGLGVEQRTTRADDTSLRARVEITYQLGRRVALPGTNTWPAIDETLSVDMLLNRGEFLVLGERTFRDGERSGSVFYVVYWPGDPVVVVP